MLAYTAGGQGSCSFRGEGRLSKVRRMDIGHLYLMRVTEEGGRGRQTTYLEPF